jgi:putative RecB family exonuclease
VNADDGQLGLAGMPRRLVTTSPSKLGAWVDCPRKYRFAYVDRPTPPKGAPWAHSSLGASIHNALAGWWRLPVERRDPAAAGRLVEAGWLQDGYRDDAQSAQWRTRARVMVEGYVATLDPADEPRGVERSRGLRTEAISVTGRIDRIDERASEDGGRELVIVDYKTGRSALTADDARGSLQLALYALATAGALRQRCRRVELHHIPTGRVLAWEHTPQSLDRHLRRAEAIALEARDATEAAAGGRAVDEAFPARTGPLCRYCDWRAHCPEGQAASTALQPWDGLAREDAAPDGPPED